jgi:hypothetical protein
MKVFTDEFATEINRLISNTKKVGIEKTVEDIKYLLMVDGYSLGEGAIIISKVLQDLENQRIGNVASFNKFKEGLFNDKN